MGLIKALYYEMNNIVLILAEMLESVQTKTTANSMMGERQINRFFDKDYENKQTKQVGWI